MFDRRDRYAVNGREISLTLYVDPTCLLRFTHRKRQVISRIALYMHACQVSVSSIRKPLMSIMSSEYNVRYGP